MNYQNVYKYFGQAWTKPPFLKVNDRYTGKFVSNNFECKKESFEKYFNTSISCSNYESVISGEGNEKDKIDTIYSSSLQSLLFFDKVSKQGIKIKINDKVVLFNEVYFEYKNKVIGYPSSVDVVLVNRKTSSICFIESKLLEIVRDSSTEGKKVIGISYFKDSGIGYKDTLRLSKEELKRLNIRYPENGPYISKVSQDNRSIDPLNGCTYVYSEGIKQVLSHLIGIVNFKNENEHYYNETEDPIVDHGFNNVYYLEVYNKLPKFGGCDKDYLNKINDFKTHFSVLKSIFREKHIVDGMDIVSYQDLYKLNSNLVSEEIANFYHLK